MSVIVMGMQMPEDCDSCWVPGQVCNLWLKTDVGNRNHDCPIRPLPEKHGRLIDAKVLDAAFTALRFNDDGTLCHWDDRKNWCLHGGEVESLIADAPTIVEAEGE